MTMATLHVDGWTAGWTTGWTAGRLDGRLAGWMDGRIALPGSLALLGHDLTEVYLRFIATDSTSSCRPPFCCYTAFLSLCRVPSCLTMLMQ